MNMALTRDFRETVQARVKRDAAFRKGLLSEAIESLTSGEVTLGKKLLRDYTNATVGFPKLAADTKIHVKTLHQTLGPNGNPTARNLSRKRQGSCNFLNGTSGAFPAVDSFRIRRPPTAVADKHKATQCDPSAKMLLLLDTATRQVLPLRRDASSPIVLHVFQTCLY
jgi:DNA-binding phage protein